jgi:tripartite-type tricarboxylate transporter receptor subunit TctC
MKKITRRSMLKGSAVAAAALALSACGGSSSSTASSASTAASAAGTAAADDIGFPKKETITLAVPGKAGGGSDLAIRYYSEGLNRIYGLKTTVTNYDSNTVGHQTVANAKPDGTTLMVATSALNIQYITGNAQVNPMTDLTLIACLEDNGFSTLAVPKNAPYDDFNGFVEYAKAHPNELNAGMPAAGANTFLFGKLCSVLGIELNKVECASESDRLTNLAGGFIDIGVVGLGNAQEYEKAGKLKVIGTVAGDGITISEYPAELPENYKTLQSDAQGSGQTGDCTKDDA